MRRGDRDYVGADGVVLDPVERRLEAFRAGRPVNVPGISSVWAQVRGLKPERLGHRATVGPDDTVTVAPETAAQWAVENGL